MREQRLWPVWYSVSEWSRALGIERKQIYEWIKRGLPVFKLGVRRKIFTQDMVAFLRANLERAEPSS